MNSAMIFGCVINALNFFMTSVGNIPFDALESACQFGIDGVRIMITDPAVSKKLNSSYEAYISRISQLFSFKCGITGQVVVSPMAKYRNGGYINPDGATSRASDSKVPTESEIAEVEALIHETLIPFGSSALIDLNCRALRTGHPGLLKFIHEPMNWTPYMNTMLHPVFRDIPTIAEMRPFIDKRSSEYRHMLQTWESTLNHLALNPELASQESAEKFIRSNLFMATSSGDGSKVHVSLGGHSGKMISDELKVFEGYQTPASLTVLQRRADSKPWGVGSSQKAAMLNFAAPDFVRNTNMTHIMAKWSTEVFTTGLRSVPERPSRLINAVPTSLLVGEYPLANAIIHQSRTPGAGWEVGGRSPYDFGVYSSTTEMMLDGFPKVYRESTCLTHMKSVRKLSMCQADVSGRTAIWAYDFSGMDQHSAGTLIALDEVVRRRYVKLPVWTLKGATDVDAPVSLDPYQMVKAALKALGVGSKIKINATGTHSLKGWFAQMVATQDGVLSGQKSTTGTNTKTSEAITKGTVERMNKAGMKTTLLDGDARGDDNEWAVECDVDPLVAETTVNRLLSSKPLGQDITVVVSRYTTSYLRNRILRFGTVGPEGDIVNSFIASNRPTPVDVEKYPADSQYAIKRNASHPREAAGSRNSLDCTIYTAYSQILMTVNIAVSDKGYLFSLPLDGHVRTDCVMALSMYCGNTKLAPSLVDNPRAVVNVPGKSKIEEINSLMSDILRGRVSGATVKYRRSFDDKARVQTTEQVRQLHLEAKKVLVDQVRLQRSIEAVDQYRGTDAAETLQKVSFDTTESARISRGLASALRADPNLGTQATLFSGKFFQTVEPVIVEMPASPYTVAYTKSSECVLTVMDHGYFLFQGIIGQQRISIDSRYSLYRSRPIPICLAIELFGLVIAPDTTFDDAVVALKDIGDAVDDALRLVSKRVVPPDVLSLIMVGHERFGAVLEAWAMAVDAGLSFKKISESRTSAMSYRSMDELLPNLDYNTGYDLGLAPRDSFLEVGEMKTHNVVHHAMGMFIQLTALMLTYASVYSEGTRVVTIPVFSAVRV